MNFKYFVYKGGPIDSFIGTFILDDFIDHLRIYSEDDPIAENEFSEGEYRLDSESAVGFADVTAYMRFFTENDLREPIRLFVIPGSLNMQYGFITKLNNNGETYIFSPVKLDYLEIEYGFSLVSEPDL